MKNSSIFNVNVNFLENNQTRTSIYWNVCKWQTSNRSLLNLFSKISRRSSRQLPTEWPIPDAVEVLRKSWCTERTAKPKNKSNTVISGWGEGGDNSMSTSGPEGLYIIFKLKNMPSSDMSSEILGLTSSVNGRSIPQLHLDSCFFQFL